MYKIYFKQAIYILKQNRFISIISILGTAFAITMIMAIIISDEIKQVNVAPEVNRDRTFYIRHEMRIKEGSSTGGSMTIKKYKEYIHEMQTPEKVSLITKYRSGYKNFVNMEGSNELHEAVVRYTDNVFWEIYSFSFLEGHPFSPEASASGLPEAIVTDEIARKIFRDENALGKTIEVNQVNYRITGIVQKTSELFPTSYSDIFLPYNSQESVQNTGAIVIILAKDKKEYQAICEEVRKAEKKYFDLNDSWNLYMQGPESQSSYILDVVSMTDSDYKEMVTIYTLRRIFILCILLFIPAINLSSLSLSRMKKRVEEIGIRKAFGAKRRVILMQVLYENLITSLIGGLIGLVLSYGVVFYMRSWLLDIPSGTSIPINTLISFPVVLAVFAACILLNLLSAGIPAYKASRTNIIDSLTQNVKTV